jgi:glyoxylase-like metal-dependent hydrolase (beta-lactamase superfamily II)
MDSVKLLIPGYAKQLPGGRWDATSATVMVKSGGKNVIIDPGMFPEELKSALDKEHQQINDIDIVVNSHSHLDHTRNAELFDKSKVWEPFKEYKKIPENLTVPGTQIKVIYTPGHVDKHLAFLVETAEGKCAVAGDVIWWEDGEEQKTDMASLLEHIDPVATDPTLLRESRIKLFTMADYIIPGHGKMFKIPR